MKDQFYQFLSRVWSPRVWQLGLKSESWLVGRLNRFAFLIMGKISRTSAGGILHFARWSVRVVKCQGYPGYSLYLKTCLVLLQNAAVGRRVQGREIGAAVACTGSGYPRLIPAAHRRAIRRGSVPLFRLWASLFSLYRIVDWKAAASLDSILLPFSGKSIEVLRFQAWIRNHFISLLRDRMPYLFDKDFEKAREKGFMECLKGNFIAVLKSGPNSVQGSVQMNNLAKDAISLRHSELWSSFIKFSEYLDFRWLLPSAIGASRDDPSLQDWGGDSRADYSRGPIGSLSLKYEPGKVRVFAMIDFWSQMALKPLHDFLLRVLRGLNRGDVRLDGTFDQAETVSYLASLPGPKFWSYDLSSATDRFPLEIQKTVIQELFNEEFGDLWATLMVGRDFVIPVLNDWCAKGKYASYFSENNPVSRVRYAVGQPMGAYSSWAAFSLSHHALVQYCAYLEGRKGWFEGYGILGDDIVIGDYAVARRYENVCQKLGVTLSLAKSLPGAFKSFEFAKRMILRGADVTSLSFREFAVANRSLTCMMELVSRCASLGPIRLASVLRALGFGYRSTARLTQRLVSIPGRKLRNTILALLHPASPFGAKHWDAWFGLETAVSFRTVDDQSTQSVIQSVVDFYKSQLSRELARFTELKNWVMKVNYPAWFEIMNRMQNDVFQSADVFGVVRGAISVSAMMQMKEVEEWVAQPVEGTLSEIYGSYRDYFARLQALRPVRNLMTRPKAKDPRFMFKELDMWYRCHRTARKAATRAKSA